MSTHWIDVNMPWRITQSSEAIERSHQFIAAVQKAQDTWRKNNPDMVKLSAGNELANEAIDIQDDYPWVKVAIDNPSADAYRNEAMRRLPEAPVEHQNALRALIIHRYAYHLENNYVNEDPDVVRTSAACQALRDKERREEFVNHPYCQVGVQIEVLSAGVTKKLLIGDIVKDGMSDGCCSCGISDEDIVVRYRDFRHLIQESDV